jgi:hypothetical protein
MDRKIRIFDYCWHIAHQWDMIHALREDCEFYYGINKFAHWNTSKRPLPPDIHFVPYYEPEKYDVALLHVDQGSIIPSSLKRVVFDQFDANIRDIPKIVMNHGTPCCLNIIKTKGLNDRKGDGATLRRQYSCIGG